MQLTQQLHDIGQSLWLDNITRDLLASGTLKQGQAGWVSPSNRPAGGKTP
jgi:hypothetical protein